MVLTYKTQTASISYDIDSRLLVAIRCVAWYELRWMMNAHRCGRQYAYASSILQAGHYKAITLSVCQSRIAASPPPPYVLQQSTVLDTTTTPYCSIIQSGAHRVPLAGGDPPLCVQRFQFVWVCVSKFGMPRMCTAWTLGQRKTRTGLETYIHKMLARGQPE